MPWRKYKPVTGKHGLSYLISRGIQVRCDKRGKWTIFIKRGGERKNKTFGSGRENLIKALKAAEKVAAHMDSPYNAELAGQNKPKAPAFREYSEDWLNDNKGRWSEYTYIRYEGILRLYLWPHEILKDKKIDEITRADIKKRLRMLLTTHSPATVELAHTILCSVIQEAVEDGILLSNPAKGLLKKLLPPKRMRNLKDADPFDIEDRDRFLECAERKCSWTEQLILKMMVHAGLRLGEALAMRLCNLDLERMNYYVCESYKQYKFSLPKKGKKRFVDLPSFLAEEFSRYVRHLKKESFKMGRGSEIDILFPDPKESGNCPVSQRKVQSIMKRVCKAAKLRIRNPHDLRHTYATILLMADKSPAYIKEQLGHSSITMTVDIYGHWMPGKGREGLEEALLGRVRKRHILAYNKKTASISH
jgi:integrase